MAEIDPSGSRLHPMFRDIRGDCGLRPAGKNGRLDDDKEANGRNPDSAGSIGR